MVTRKQVVMKILDKNFNDVIKIIKAGDVYVCQAPSNDDISTLLKKESDDRFQIVFYQPITHTVQKARLRRKELYGLIAQLIANTNLKHYGVEDNEGLNMIEHFGSISDALIALERGGYKDYKVKRFS